MNAEQIEALTGYTRQDFEYLRIMTLNEWMKIQPDWLELLRWTIPERAKWIETRCREHRNKYTIIDGTHTLAHRSFVAGFLEGNTSANRLWYRYGHPDPDVNNYEPNRKWLDRATQRAMSYLGMSNFYHEASQFYYDFGAVNTGAHIIQKAPRGLHFTTLVPGSYRVVNNALGEAEILIYEFSMTSKALVGQYGHRLKDGNYNYDNFSNTVKRLYEMGNYVEPIEMVTFVVRNKRYDPNKPLGGNNREWVSVTYEIGLAGAMLYTNPITLDFPSMNVNSNYTYTDVSFYRRRPFIIGKSHSSNNWAYGEKGPTSDAIGLIRSLNKKGISKDVAIEKMLEPTFQGPAHLRKAYLTSQARKYIPLDATAMAQGGVKTIYEFNPAIAPLMNDVEDMRQQVNKFYYADLLQYLSMNPKTRTATETQAIVNEQQNVLGPYLQSLNWSYNMPIAEWLLDFVIHEDPYLGPPPKSLEGEWINTEFVSVFAQVQKAADLPMINQYVDRWTQLAQLQPQAWQNLDLDVLNKIYSDRYYLPAGLAASQTKVDAMRKQAQMQAQRQQMIESMPQIGQGAKAMADARATASANQNPSQPQTNAADQFQVR